MTMALAYWCVLAAAALPYVWTSVAKASGERYDNRDPRGWMARQTDPRVHRANAAQLNAFEAFPAFAAAVLMAQLAAVHEGRIALLAVAFVVFRFLHGLVYTLGMKHSIRSMVWFLAFGCVQMLMAMAALRLAVMS